MWFSFTALIKKGVPCWASFKAKLNPTVRRYVLVKYTMGRKSFMNGWCCMSQMISAINSNWPQLLCSSVVVFRLLKQYVFIGSVVTDTKWMKSGYWISDTACQYVLKLIILRRTILRNSTNLLVEVIVFLILQSFSF